MPIKVNRSLIDRFFRQIQRDLFEHQDLKVSLADSRDFTVEQVARSYLADVIPRKASRHRGKERWKPIVGYEYYSVSNHGRVKRTLTQSGKPCNKIKMPGVINGYHIVQLHGDARQTSIGVHRLVALHFLKCPRNHKRMKVNHKDNDPGNNHVSNLEWLTHAENKRHSTTTLGLGSGENNATASLSNSQVRTCRQLISKGLTNSEIAVKLKAKPSAIAGVRSGRTYRSIQ